MIDECLIHAKKDVSDKSIEKERKNKDNNNGFYTFASFVVEGFGMLQIAICDDEKYFQKRERNIVINYMKQRNIPCEIDLFLSGRELLNRKDDLKKYSIIFLDVNMDELNGLQTAKQIRSLSDEIYIVFVTAYVMYALEGYKVDAIRYIVKDDECLENTIAESLDAIFQRMNYIKESEKFEFREGTKEILLEQILFVESNLHKLTFHFYNKDVKYTMYERLDVVAERLNHYNFCRIHKSYLVNLRYVEKIERYQLQLCNGLEINIAKPRYPEVKNKFISYKGDI